MDEHQGCEACSRASGCTARHTPEKDSEEIKAAPYLAFCVLVIVIASLLVRWLW